jgi:hypothetical protein
MLQQSTSTDAIERVAWFELRSEADGAILESNLTDNNPPRRVPGQLFLDAGGAPWDALRLDTWRNDPQEAGKSFRVRGHGILVMLGWSWDEARTPGDTASRRLVETLHAQSREEWVDEAAKAIAAGRDGDEVEAALIDRWHARRRGMLERDGRPLVPSIDLIHSAPWFSAPSADIDDGSLVAVHAEGWVLSDGDDGYFYQWDIDQFLG